MGQCRLDADVTIGCYYGDQTTPFLRPFLFGTIFFRSYLNIYACGSQWVKNLTYKSPHMVLHDRSRVALAIMKGSAQEVGVVFALYANFYQLLLKLYQWFILDRFTAEIT